MSDDIVTRLRCSYNDPPCLVCTFCVARAEIMRLREYITALQEDRQIAGNKAAQLCAAGDALVGALESNLMATAVVLVNQWKEARRD